MYSIPSSSIFLSNNLIEGFTQYTFGSGIKIFPLTQFNNLFFNDFLFEITPALWFFPAFQNNLSFSA